VPHRHLAWFVFVPLFVVALSVWSFSTPPPEGDYKRMHAIADVLAEVDKSYYRELSEDEKKAMVEAMIKGGLHSLDPYSEYFNEQDLKQFTSDNRGVFGGIGAMLDVDLKTGKLTVDAPVPDSPAMEAGLLSKDEILKVDGLPVDPKDPDASRGKIKGEPGTKVTLNIQRGAKNFDVTITRAIIQINAVKGFRRSKSDAKAWDYIIDKDSAVGIIRLAEFSEKAFTEVQAALKSIDEAGGKALILDMRFNGGGLLNMAEKISDLFLAEGTIVQTKDRYDLGKVTKATRDGSVWEDGKKRPMVVLLNGASASATEIVAAALQENKRAIVVGERSFGKGSVQRSIIAQDEKSGMKLTTQIWLTPSGRHIDKGLILTKKEREDKTRNKDEFGVKPDDGYEVKMTDPEVIQYFLHQREVDRSREPREAPKPTGNRAKDELPEIDPAYRDPVIEKAMEYLKKAGMQAQLKRASEPS
jgi:carboxyl-terminal processing protease